MIALYLCYLPLWEKDGQPLHGHVRKDGFGFSGLSREVDVMARDGQEQGWRARWEMGLRHLEGRHTGEAVPFPTPLQGGPVCWITWGCTRVSAPWRRAKPQLEPTHCPLCSLPNLSGPALDGLWTQDKSCLWTFHYWRLFSSLGRNTEVPV